MVMKQSNLHVTRHIMLTLLPVQILLAAVGAVNGIVSSYFASNYVGIDAMSAVGLYGPVQMLLGAVGIMMSAECAASCSKYLGQNRTDSIQKLFSTVLFMSCAIGMVFTVLLVIMAVFNLTGLFTQDLALRAIFNRYLLGQCLGIIPSFIAGQLPVFLTIDNKGRRTIIASIIYIFVNLILNYVFVQIMRLEELGLALASSIGMWVFMGVELQYFLTSGASVKVSTKGASFREGIHVLRDGFPDGLTHVYQTVRGFVVNNLLGTYAGSMGISAFAAANSVMGIFWSIPTGMESVSRIMIGVSTGEEDRQTLEDIMTVMMKVYLPLMIVVDAEIILCSGMLSGIFFSEQTVRGMMTACLRILPLCMPFSIILMHFNCYGQASGKLVYVHILSLLDGLASVALFSYILTPRFGVKGVAIANIINGLVTTIFIIGYAWWKLKRVPRNMGELMVIPEDFGVADDERIDISIHSSEEVVTLSRRIQEFCLSKGIDKRRAYLSALALEEMAGNIVDHGFTKDRRSHYVDVRVVHQGDNVILRIKDDCVPFNPRERRQITENDDITKNIGIRMIYTIIKDIEYQNLFGMNVLTMKV